MSHNDADDLTEKIKILATDDEKIKSFGELLTNDSSREILQLLFNEELTANQIAQKTGISLQLVKYHLIKLQDLGIVKISKIEKNSKSQDMKIYSATKFSIVIVPPKFSEKTKESKLLVRSFRHIYKVTGLGIATGLSGLFSLSQFKNETTYVGDSETGDFSSVQSTKSIQSATTDESLGSFPTSAPMAESESQDAAQYSLEVAETVVNSEIAVNSELFLPFLIITVILGGLTTYYFWKFKKCN
ncbi:MAG: ArsR/SmtB family transcription factor [Nitrosopumilus sp.]